MAPIAARTRAGSLAIVAIAAGCVQPGPPVAVVAAGGGAGYWPANSRTAVSGALDLEFDGIELDVVLSRDLVPVLASSPVLDPRRCTRTNGEALTIPTLIRRIRADQLAAGYRCGGVPEPAFGQAEVVADALMPLEEVTRALHNAPGSVAITLDIQQRSPMTVRPDRFAEAILGAWYAEDLPQDLVISSPLPEVIEAFDIEGRRLGIDVVAMLVYPDPGDGIDDGAAVEIEKWSGGTDYVAILDQTRADGILVRSDLADPRLLRAVRDEGRRTGLWTVDAPRELQRIVARREVDMVLTNYPGDAP